MVHVACTIVFAASAGQEIKTAKPLYVLDGVIMPSDSLYQLVEKNGSKHSVLSAIDPNDIEQISVLKGPDAVAKYGEKGKDGVILITTIKKRPKKSR